MSLMPVLPVLDAPGSSRSVERVKPGLVTLIRPARLSSRGCWSVPFTPPLGLAYLAAVLRDENVPVKVIDGIAEGVNQFLTEDTFYFQGLTIEQILDRIDPETDVIGVSCMFSQDWPYARRLLTAIRHRLPHAMIVAGGEHVTALAEESLRDCEALDVIVLGEGEETLVDLATHPRDKAAWRDIHGLAYLHDGQFIQTHPRARIREVDEMPWPAWDLFPMEVYLSSDNMYGVNRGRTIGVLATRGCPYQCTFCSNPKMYGKAWEAREPELVLDEIEHLIKTYNVQNIDFYDLTMVLKKQWILEFCAAIERRGMRFTWQLPSGTRSEIVDDEVAAALYRTGCTNLCFAPESGSKDTLVKIKKKVDLKKMMRAIRAARRQGIHVKCNIIIGFPHETRRHILASLGFCWRLAVAGVDAAETMVFSPYPGTELFEQLRKEGLIDTLDDNYYKGLSAFLDPFKTSKYCKHVSGKELAFWRIFNMTSFMALSFALRPWRIARLVWNVLRNKSDTVIEHRLGVFLHRKKVAVSAPSQQEVLAPS